MMQSDQLIYKLLVFFRDMDSELGEEHNGVQL